MSLGVCGPSPISTTVAHANWGKGRSTNLLQRYFCLFSAVALRCSVSVLSIKKFSYAPIGPTAGTRCALIQTLDHGGFRAEPLPRVRPADFAPPGCRKGGVHLAKCALPAALQSPGSRGRRKR